MPVERAEPVRDVPLARTARKRIDPGRDQGTAFAVDGRRAPTDRLGGVMVGAGGRANQSWPALPWTGGK